MDLVAVCKNELRVFRSSCGWEKPVATISSAAYNPEGFDWSQDGSLCACINTDGGVTVYDANLDYSPVFEAKKQFNAVRSFYFSPNRTFLVTHERYVTKDNKDNVFVFNLANPDKPVVSFIMKVNNERTWPCMVWTSDERFVLHMVSNEIQVMHGRNPTFDNILYKLRIPDICQFSLSPNDKFIAAFIPELKGQPASVRIIDLQDRSATPKAVKSFFKAQNMNFKWSKSGLGLLVVATTDADDKSQSYYGSSALYFMRIDDAGKSLAESLLSEGGVHDACWSPASDEFLAITGTLPSEMALYDGRTGLKKVSFGKVRRNTIRWNPFGRVFMSAGFGNLSGTVDIWDKNKGLCISTMQLPCSVLSDWGADGRTLMTATTTPRMRVDNGFQLTNYDGTGISKSLVGELYFVSWRPGATFPDVPPSPRVVALAKKPEEEPAVAAYRPRVGGAFAEQMRKEKEEENLKKAKKLTPVAPEVQAVVGLMPVMKKKSRNERKKEAKAKSAFNGNDSDSAAEWVSAKNTVKPVTPPSGNRAPAVADEDSDREEDPKKKLRNLSKKLRDLEKLASKSPEELNNEQKVKLQARPQIEADIAALKKLLNE